MKAVKWLLIVCLCITIAALTNTILIALTVNRPAKPSLNATSEIESTSQPDQIITRVIEETETFYLFKPSPFALLLPWSVVALLSLVIILLLNKNKQTTDQIK